MLPQHNSTDTQNASHSRLIIIIIQKQNLFLIYSLMYIMNQQIISFNLWAVCDSIKLVKISHCSCINSSLVATRFVPENWPPTVFCFCFTLFRIYYVGARGSSDSDWIFICFGRVRALFF